MMAIARLTVAAAVTLAVAQGAASVAPQSDGARPKITGVNHIAVRVSDLAAAGRFYGDVLGLAARSASSSRAVFDIGHRQRVVLEAGLAASEDERLSHLAFETPDVKALSAFLASRGMEPQPARQCDDGSIRVTDPDGHVIEFVPAKWPPERRAAAPGRSLSSRLLHAGLTVADEQAAHRFYRDILGFSEIWRGGRKEGVTQWVNMRVPNGTDYLEYMLVSSPPDRRQRGVLHHLALLVPDIQAAWEEAARRTPEAARAQLNSPQIGVNGRWQLNLFDPDGTRAELMEPFTAR